jgi:hypothetical protein
VVHEDCFDTNVPAPDAMSDFVCGANEADFHYTGANWGRDLPEPEVVDLRNQSGGHAWSLTGQVQRPWSDRFEVHASYTYSRVRDVHSLTSVSAGPPLDVWAGEREQLSLVGKRRRRWQLLV